MNDWITGICLASIIVAVYILAFLRKKNDRKLDERQSEVWQELARQTGLSFNTNPSLSVEGEYHSHHLILQKFPFDSENPQQLLRTLITLWLKVPPNFTIAVQKDLRPTLKSFVIHFSTGIDDFNRRFSIEGEPYDFARSAMHLIDQTDPRLLEWAIQNDLSIKLNGGGLICRCDNMVIDVQMQITLLDLLCDLAELVEEAGGDQDHGKHEE